MSTPSGNANVISLQIDKPSNARSEAVMKESLARLPRPVQRIREIAQTHLKGSIQNLFDHVDDSLFELADRAVSNLEQNVFFESMREIRIQRRSMEKSFLYHIDQHFAGLLGGDHALPQSQTTALDVDTDDLSLVSKDELEELVAIDSVVSKAWSQNKNALRVLVARMNTLVAAGVSDKNNPLTPRSLADSFVEASSIIDVDIKAKLVLFKLFERYVMSELAEVLNKVNHALTEQGVPIPKAPTRRQGARNSVPGVRQADSTATNSSVNESVEHKDAGTAGGGLYATLQSLLDNQPQAQHGQSNFAETGYAASADNYAVTEVSYALLNALSQLQQQQLQQVPVAQTLQEGQSQLLSSGNIETAIHSATGEQLVDEHSQDVIKLVDMLFSFILEDRNLPDPVKLLLTRLQIPFIKVALADEEFFKKDGHPARRLLNEMAMASIGWSGEADNSKRDTLLNKIESTVSRILEEFDSNFEIFTLLLTDFIAFMEKERRRVMLFERRAIDAEDGKAKSEVGRQKVDAQLNELVSGKPLPESFTSFIQGPWSNILFLIYMRQGVDSQQWTNALKVAKELIWTALPIQNDEHKEKLTARIPRLQSALKKGLENISFNPVKQAKFFEKFNAHYAVLLEDYKKPIVAEPLAFSADEDDKSLSSKKPVETLTNPSASKNQSVITEEPTVEKISDNAKVSAKQADASESIAKKEIIEPAAAPIVDSEKAAIVKSSPVAKPEIKKPKPAEQRVAPTVEKKPATVTVDQTAAKTKEPVADSQYVNLVDNFTVGVWFEKADQASSAYRCRLAAIIRSTGKYIFVNRAGVKVAEETRESLAMQLQTGKLRTLDDSMLFDRALESVITNLRRSK